MKKILRETGVALAVLLAGCAGKKTEIRTAEEPLRPPVLEFAGVKFQPDSFSALEMSWHFELQGRDRRPLDATGCVYRLEMEGLEPASGQLAAPGPVAAGEKKTLSVNAGVPWPAERGQVAEFLLRQKIPYKLEISCQAGGEKIQAGDSGNIPLQKLPKLTVSGANAERFSGKEFRLNFELSLANENAFPIQVRKINYRISVEGRKLSEGSLPVEEVVSASADTLYEITSGTLSVAVDKSVGDLLKKTNLSYRLEGEVEFEGLSISVDESGSVSFPR